MYQRGNRGDRGCCYTAHVAPRCTGRNLVETPKNLQHPVLVVLGGAVENFVETPENLRHPLLAVPGGAVDGDQDPVNLMEMLENPRHPLLEIAR